MNIPADFSLNAEHFQLRGIFETLFQEVKPPLLALQFKVSHFVRIPTNAMSILIWARTLNIACLTSLKIVCIISYIEHTHDQAALIQRGSAVASANPFQDSCHDDGTCFLSVRMCCVLIDQDTKEPLFPDL